MHGNNILEQTIFLKFIFEGFLDLYVITNIDLIRITNTKVEKHENSQLL